MFAPLVLSLFPGIGLLDLAFELEGFTVVKGPDLIWGGDVRDFGVPPGRFDGVIGGPPCQVFSRSRNLATWSFRAAKHDLIPEFVRVVMQARPSFVVMENVREAIGHAAIPPEWQAVILRDWDCGGLTSRSRAFWSWPMRVNKPVQADGQPAYSVLASATKRGRTNSRYVKDKRFLPGDLPIKEYARLQGAARIADALSAHNAGKEFIVRGLGNGVPLAMGRYVARAVRGSIHLTNNL